jgi:hypothetical protein
MKTKTASEGLFFEKRSQPRRGHFFRDMAGRDDGKFHQKSAAQAGAPTTTPTKTQDLGQLGGPAGAVSDKGENTGGVGIYGTGSGKKASPTDRLQDILENSAGGEKTASRAPSDYDADSGMPTGFHRAASKQPEALEDGGERFHTESSGPSRGLVEGGKMNLAKGTGQNMGKHASVARFMGTSYGMDKSAAKKDTTFEDSMKRKSTKYTSQAGDSLRRGGSQAVESLESGLDTITKSPILTAAGALLLGRAGVKSVGKLGRLALGRKKPVGVAAGALGGLKRMITGR